MLAQVQAPTGGKAQAKQVAVVETKKEEVVEDVDLGGGLFGGEEDW